MNSMALIEVLTQMRADDTAPCQPFSRTYD